jgi:hypothetical protein
MSCKRTHLVELLPCRHSAAVQMGGQVLGRAVTVGAGGSQRLCGAKGNGGIGGRIASEITVVSLPVCRFLHISYALSEGICSEHFYDVDFTVDRRTIPGKDSCRSLLWALRIRTIL